MRGAGAGRLDLRDCLPLTERHTDRTASGAATGLPVAEDDACSGLRAAWTAWA